jgi:hypothetical protein
MANIYKIFRDLIPDSPLLIGTVTSSVSGGCHVLLPTGGSVLARGEATVGQKVFVRDGVIEGIAPILAIELIEI